MLLKICGIRRPEDIASLNMYPPDYAGFVFSQSKRQVTPQQAKELISSLSGAIKRVGVFVNEEPEWVCSIAAYSGLTVVQLHGDETDNYIEAVRRRLPQIEIWKAVRVKNAGSLEQAQLSTADMLLYDAFSSSAYGGTGQTANWDLICNFPAGRPFFLAGGLDLGTCKKAMHTIAPAGIDLSSGVETNGYKDREKISKIVSLVKG